MEGKKNIVFGFVYLIATAALGLVMVNLSAQVGNAAEAKQEKLSNMQQGLQMGFDMMPEKEPVPTMGEAVMALNTYINAQEPIDGIKGGPHAHGNLESVLNIIVGTLLMFLAIPAILKQVISWLFILATLLHSGMLYLSNPNILGWSWAGTVLDTGIGPIALLVGFGLMAIAVFIGLKPQRQA
ncbi:hypothetical protein [Thiohalorhabdus sp.]|uniref:hypothetical protein n=1 Tax=Thiohalorhabdus sp. TaxID=3094134 RepID=UPI002FC3281C